MFYVFKIKPFCLLLNRTFFGGAYTTYSHFNTSSIILSSTWTDKDEANNLTGFIDSLLLDKLKYAQEQNGRYWLELTDIGRAVQKAGGHFLYLKRHADNETTETMRQQRKDKADELDLKIKRWTYKARYVPFVFSTIALIISICTYFKPQKVNSVKQHVTSNTQALLPNVILNKKNMVMKISK